MLRPCVCICIGGRTTLCALRDCVRTSASNFLYSSSLDALYSSISFLASSRASLTRFVLYSRAVHQQVSVSSARRCGCSQADVVLGAFVHFWTILEASFSACDCCQPNLKLVNLRMAAIPREGSGYPRSSGRTVMLLLLACRRLDSTLAGVGRGNANHVGGRFECAGNRTRERYLIC